MAKYEKPIPTWHDEIEKNGLKEALKDRLKFHGGMNLDSIVNHAGCAQNTAKRHLNSLVKAGYATVQFLHDDWHYRYKPTI